MTDKSAIEPQKITLPDQAYQYATGRFAPVVAECAKQAIHVELLINLAFFTPVIFASREQVQNYKFNDYSFSNISKFFSNQGIITALGEAKDAALGVSLNGAAGHFASCVAREVAYDAIDYMELDAETSNCYKMTARSLTGILKYAIKYSGVREGIPLIIKSLEGGVNQLLYFFQKNDYDSVHAEILSGLVTPILESVIGLTKGQVILPKLSDIGVNALIGYSIPSAIKAHQIASPLEDYLASSAYNGTANAGAYLFGSANETFSHDPIEL